MLQTQKWMLQGRIGMHAERKEVADTKRRKVSDNIFTSVLIKNKWHAHGV